MHIVIGADPCEPEPCTAVREECLKSTKCSGLLENVVDKCADVLNSTINTCSDECKNATYELYSDPQGYHYRECDCGMYGNSFFVGPNNPEELAAIDYCYATRSLWRDLCGVYDAGQCHQCEAKKGM